MKLFEVDRDVMSGQCKGALLRIQVRYTALFILPGIIRGWSGGQLGLFIPRKTDDGYACACTGFRFNPWLTPDVPMGKLPAWYRWTMRTFSFRWD